MQHGGRGAIRRLHPMGGVGHLVQIVGVRAGNKAQTVQIGTLKKAGRTMAGELSQRKP